MNFCCCSLAGTAACNSCPNRPSNWGYYQLPQFEYDFNPNTGTVTPTTIPIGWVCPRCCTVHAPDIKTCDCKPPERQVDKEKSYAGEGLVQPMSGYEEDDLYPELCGGCKHSIWGGDPNDEWVPTIRCGLTGEKVKYADGVECPHWEEMDDN